MSDIVELIKLNNQAIKQGNKPLFSLFNQELGLDIHDVLRDPTGQFDVDPDAEYGEVFIRDFLKEGTLFQQKALDIIFSKTVLQELRSQPKFSERIAKELTANQLIKQIDTEYQSLFNLAESNLSVVPEDITKPYLSGQTYISEQVFYFAPPYLASTFNLSRKFGSEIVIRLQSMDYQETPVPIWEFYSEDCKAKQLLIELTS